MSTYICWPSSIFLTLCYNNCFDDHLRKENFNNTVWILEAIKIMKSAGCPPACKGEDVPIAMLTASASDVFSQHFLHSQTLCLANAANPSTRQAQAQRANQGLKRLLSSDATTPSSSEFLQLLFDGCLEIFHCYTESKRLKLDWHECKIESKTWPRRFFLLLCTS